MRYLSFALVLLPLAGCVEPGAAKMALPDAEVFCAPQAQSYARRPIPVSRGGSIQVGLLAEMPDDYLVQEFYRACVFAKSGQRPRAPVKWRL